jgi:hypothetical protein
MDSGSRRGTRWLSDPCIFLFFCGFGIFHPRSHDLKHTHTSSFPRRVFAPGVLHRCFAHPNRGVGGAPRNVRVLSGTPVGHAITRRARRLRGALRPIARQDARERAYDAGRSPLGAPPWRFWAPGAALPAPSAPAILQRRAGALRIRAASSSHPGRSAWRAGSLPPETSGYEPPPQDATPRSAFRIVSGDAPQ